MEERMQTTMVYVFLEFLSKAQYQVISKSTLLYVFLCRFLLVCICCALQLTGVLIGAVVAVFLIGVSVLLLYRRYKLASKFHFSVYKQIS